MGIKSERGLNLREIYEKKNPFIQSKSRKKKIKSQKEISKTN